MRASNTYNNSGSKVTKIAIVTALHLGVALALINMKIHTAPPPPVDAKPITRIDETFTPPEPVEVDTSTKKVEPTIWVPDTVVVTEPPPDTIVAKKLPPGPTPPPTEGPAGPKIVDVPVAPPKVLPFTPVAFGNCARPDYPASAARNGESGTVNLALLIGVDGKVSDAKIDRTSGSRTLDRAAVAALSMCKFKPATNNGVAEPAWGKLAYVWTLE